MLQQKQQTFRRYQVLWINRAWGAAKVYSAHATHMYVYLRLTTNVVVWSTDVKNRKPPNMKVMHEYHCVVVSARATFPAYRSPTDWTILVSFVKVVRNEANWRNVTNKQLTNKTSGNSRRRLSNAMDWVQSRPAVPRSAWRNANTEKWHLFVKFTSNFLNPLKPSGHYMDHTAVTICTAQRSQYVPHSGRYVYRTVVTSCTASLTFNNSTFCPHSCIYVFYVDLRTNSDYFPIQH